MVLTAIYSDGSWVEGKTYFHLKYSETFGTHHLKVIDGSEEFKDLLGKKIAIVINNVKYFIIS